MFDLSRYWYQKSLHPFLFVLLPFSWLFCVIVWIRRFLYRAHILKTQRLAHPVVVVGNLSVGGTGKTPMVLMLAEFLKKAGYRPGIISRGVGGKCCHKAYFVKADDTPKKVGDEAILFARLTNCPVVIGRKRAEAGKYLLSKTDCNIVISDDGLQHYALGREIEIIMVDALRQFGNGRLLPAGPLRESIKRLQKADFIMSQGKQAKYTFNLITRGFVSLVNQQAVPLSYFRGKKIHVVAAIGNPHSFFKTLRAAGLDIIPHVFPDHYLYQAADFNFTDPFPILMTEKDAVKCMAFANDKMWYTNTLSIAHESFPVDLLDQLKKIGETHEAHEAHVYIVDSFKFIDPL